MAPYKRRYYRRGNRDKYSVEQTAGTVTTNTAGNGGVVVVPPATIQGMRKVKHLTITLGSGQSGAASVFYWALVYVPQGTAANTINVDDNSMYEPNQYVMNCGVCDLDAGPQRIGTPLSRNLNSGDNISLIIYNSSGTAVSFRYVVRYAITLQ